MITLSELPKTWELVKLEDVSLLITDGTHKTPKYVEKGIPFISIANIRPFKKITFEKYRKYISPKEHKELSKRAKPEKDDILFSRIGTLGIAKRIDFDYEVSIFVGLGLIKPRKDVINPKYLELYMNSPFVGAYSKNFANGSGRLTLPLESSRKMPVPIPSLKEQDCIVEKVEELFSELDIGIESLKTAHQQLKVYRQSVLKWAFEGNQFSKEWSWVALEKVTDKITDGEHFRPRTQEKGIPFLSAKDVRDEGVSFDDPLFISEETAKKSWQRCSPQKGDILIVSRGATVGRMCIVNTDEKFCLLGSVILIKLSKSVNNKFICYALKSPATNQIITSVSGATAQQAIYLRDIKNIKIPICPLEEQQRIVDEIESRLSVCDKIEETIDQSLKQAEALRQSILKKAFEGKLVPQDPNDEPASKLLERIRAAKQENR